MRRSETSAHSTSGGSINLATKKPADTNFQTFTTTLGTDMTKRITADINQFHHYPGGRTPLAPHTCDVEFPAIIGEFATAGTVLFWHTGGQVGLFA